MDEQIFEEGKKIVRPTLREFLIPLGGVAIYFSRMRKISEPMDKKIGDAARVANVYYQNDLFAAHMAEIAAIGGLAYLVSKIF